MNELLILINKGGPAIWILLACALIVIWVSLEKFLFYLKVSGKSPLSPGEIQNGKRAESCGRYSYLYLVNEAVNEGVSKEKRDAAREAFMARVERDMSRGQPTLATISVISPFVGLFGTVIGIMHAFFKVAEEGKMTPAVVGAGIAEALIATAAGLLVAIISVVMYNVFKSRMYEEISELEILRYETDASGGEEQ